MAGLPAARGVGSVARGLGVMARDLEVLAFVTRACVVGFLPLSGSEPEGMRKWRNRQTRTVQVRVSERTWGFNSPLAHHPQVAESQCLQGFRPCCFRVHAQFMRQIV